MSKESSRSAASVATAKRLIDRAVTTGAADPAVVGAALQQTCSRVFGNLRDAMGDDGCNALLARALARAEGAHPALKTIRRLYGDSIHLDGVAAGVESFGPEAVTAAIEALLAALVEVLGRIIGDDMAIRLIDSDPRQPPTNGAKTP